MKIVFYSVVLNQHQAPIADELWKLTNHEFVFVELINLGDMKGGVVDYSKRPYLLKAWENEENYKVAMELCISADCCIFSGIESLSFETERMKHNKLSFEMSERWFKKGIFNLLSPRLWKWLFEYYKGRWKYKDLYKLCCSAYCASDHYKLLTFKSKCYRWGYFTRVPESFQHTNRSGSDSHELRIMWCARFIDWKHPEIPIKLAAKLKDYFSFEDKRQKTSYYSSFRLDMFGDGELLSRTKSLAQKLDVADRVLFHGNMPNDIIRDSMRNHDLFLFTSDKGEGWGAVANEAMSEGCVLVGSDKIGSVPFLVEDGINGFTFKDKDVESLFEVILKVISYGERLAVISHNGYLTMNKHWSPQVAAQSLMTLIEGIERGDYCSIEYGPCSRI